MLEPRGVCYLLILFCFVLETYSTIYDCKCHGDVCQMVQEADAKKDCYSTNTDSLTLPAGLFDPVQQRVELVVKNLNLISTSGVFQNTSEAMTKIVSIDLSGNRMSEIQANEFSSVVDVEILNIGNNQLSVIKQNAFSGLVKLTTLILWVNHLANIPNFSELTSLATLNLRSNRFRQLDVVIFALAKGLKQLFLESNNIQIIQKSVRYTGIKELFLQNNQLTDIEDLKKFENLITLNLSSNPSLRLTPKSFFRWHSLQYLNIDNIDLEGSSSFKEILQDVAPTLLEISLSNNRLENFTVAAFPPLSNLVTLKIKDNRLTRFDYDQLRITFPNISQIAITGNRWDCEYLKEMIGDFKKRGIKLVDVRTHTDDIVNVDGVTCFAADGASIYVIIMIALGVVIVLVAICLFFIKLFVINRRDLRTGEQRPLRTKSSR